MKKILTILGSVLLLIQVASFCRAVEIRNPGHKVRIQYITYKVIDTQEHSITIRDRRGREIIVNKEPKGLKIGDEVRYDKLRFKLKRYPKKSTR